MEVTIERILPGGLGLAHAEGRTIMVALAAPGDRVRVRIDRVKGNVSFAVIEEIITPSPHRVEPPCPYFGRCGGCDFQQLTYQAQLDAKVEIIKDCLRRLGGIENVPDFQITPAPNAWHYRSRAQWQYDAIRQRLGYFESGSRHVCDVSECAVLAPELQQTLESLRTRMTEGLVPDDARDFRAVVGNEGVSIAPSVPGSSPTVREGSDLGFEQRGVSDITRTIHGETYRFNAELFFQANDGLLPQLIDAAIGDANGETAIDLYCGVGLFTLPLARRFKHVLGVEGDTLAASFARANLANAGLGNAEVANRNVRDLLEHNAATWLEKYLSETFQKPDSVVPGRAARPGWGGEGGQLNFLLLDPPRTGAESKVINGISKLKPQKLCYVSCDPATLARDLKKLIASGYALDSIAAFDMFPQTHHVETIVHLTG
jgi:23S rRNA (uracil1939-C5)-methyltransferase